MKDSADFNVSNEQFKAIQSADVIRLTDGKEYVRKDVAVKIMEKYLSEYKSKLRTKIAETCRIDIDSVLKLIDDF